MLSFHDADDIAFFIIDNTLYSAIFRDATD